MCLAIIDLFKKNPVNKNLFEHRQNELEGHTELLSKLLEEDNVHNLFNKKEDIINVTKLAFKSSRAFLDVSINSEEVTEQSKDDKDIQRALERSMKIGADEDLQNAMNNSVQTGKKKKPRKKKKKKILKKKLK